MKYCSKCGAEVNEDAVVCVKCGCTVEHSSVTRAMDQPNTGLAVLAFFFPIIGLIMWLVWKNKYPIKAKSVGKGALIGVIVSVALAIVISIICGALVGSMLNSYY